MSLATRCPACDTVFRITTHDATVQSGNVRCGVCDAVFNALDALIRMEDLGDEPIIEASEEAVIDTQGEAAADTALEAALSSTPSFAAPESYVLRESTVVDQPIHPAPKKSDDINDAPPRVLPVLDLPPENTEGDASALTPEAVVSASDTSAIAAPDIDTIFDVAGPKTRIPGISASALDLDLDRTTESELATEALTENEIATDAVTDTAGDLLFAPPSFLNRDPAPTVSQPGRAKWWLALSALALLLLLGQAVYFWRDALAAQSPWANKALKNTCAVIGCRIELPMRIEAILVESSELQAVPDTTNRYVFSTLLRSRSATPLRYPALELSLTDAADQVVARRVFLPEQYLDAAPRSPLQNGLAGNSELPVKINFEVTDIKVIGYRIGVFYP